MSRTVYTLGGVAFTAVGGIAPQKLDMAIGWTWAEVPRIGKAPALQRTGREPEKWTFSGKLASELGSGEAELIDLAIAADEGAPLVMTRGDTYLGRMVVESIATNAGVLNADGTARASTFTISLKQYVE